MKLHLADTRSRNTLTGYGPGYLAVNGIRYDSALIITPDALPQPWPVTRAADLGPEAVAQILSTAPEIILIGTGPAQVFPSPAQLRPLIEARVGLEIMNTPAACRTYNVLMGEGRRVTAAMCLP
jgi:uncharacterized protein